MIMTGSDGYLSGSQTQNMLEYTVSLAWKSPWSPPKIPGSERHPDDLFCISFGAHFALESVLFETKNKQSVELLPGFIADSGRLPHKSKK